MKMRRYKAPVKYVTSVHAKDMTFFLKILFRWTGSVWQKLYIDAFIFIALWIAINVTYSVYLQKGDNQETLKKFNAIVLHIKKIGDGVELTMVLGFFVSTVFRRWWQVAMSIPRTTSAAFTLQCYTMFVEDKVVAQNIRTQVLRYMNLSWVLAMRQMCPQICKRFHIAQDDAKMSCCRKCRLNSCLRGKFSIYHNSNFLPAINIRTCLSSGEEEVFELESINKDGAVKKYCPGGLIKKSEARILNQFIKKKRLSETEYLLPLQWASRLLTKSSRAKLFRSDGDLKDLLKVVDDFRKSLENLMTHNEIHIPLVYTQIVVIAVYSYLLAELFTTHTVSPLSREETPFNSTVVDTVKKYVQRYAENDGRDLPIYSIFKFIFFMGWFKTAVALLNPLGSDREALPTSVMLTQNLETSFDIANDTGFFPSWLDVNADSVKHLGNPDMTADHHGSGYCTEDEEEETIEETEKEETENEEDELLKENESTNIKMVPV